VPTSLGQRVNLLGIHCDTVIPNKHFVLTSANLHCFNVVDRASIWINLNWSVLAKSGRRYRADVIVYSHHHHYHLFIKRNNPNCTR